MLSNSEFVVMLNQAASDRGQLAKLLNISNEQMSYITNADAGCGLIKYGSALVPFINRFPQDTKLYQLTLSGVFSSFDDANWTDKTKLSDERLKDLIEHMSKLKVGNNNYSADDMGDSYEFLIKKFADLSKKNAGEFYTPRSIVKLLIMLLAPKAGETVYDPACGTGGMLIEAIRFMHGDKLTYVRILRIKGTIHRRTL